jgi:hypothetical protein
VRGLFSSTLILRIPFVKMNRERELRKMRDKGFPTLRSSPNDTERHGIAFYCLVHYRLFPSTDYMELNPS